MYLQWCVGPLLTETNIPAHMCRWLEEEQDQRHSLAAFNGSNELRNTVQSWRNENRIRQRWCCFLQSQLAGGEDAHVTFGLPHLKFIII